MLVSFALGDAKVPNANGFALQWNIGLRLMVYRADTIFFLDSIIQHFGRSPSSYQVLNCFYIHVVLIIEQCVNVTFFKRPVISVGIMLDELLYSENLTWFK